MKITRRRALGIAIISLLIVLWGLELFTNFDLAQAIFSNLAFVLLGIIFVALMSAIGGFFLGMWISARFFSTKGFTPFEEEMLRMREDVKALRERLEKVESTGAPGAASQAVPARTQPPPAALHGSRTEADGGETGQTDLSGSS
ncbi:MAG TPA: hypothetical protein VI893_10650 [Thermoplasmata archaeon]|nr:hypothetical protein [Thermoplasmata archaeon]